MMLKIGQLVSCRFVLSVVNGQLAVRAALFSPSAPPSTQWVQCHTSPHPA